MSAEQEHGPQEPMVDLALQQRIQEAIEPLMANFRQQVAETVKRQLQKPTRPGEPATPTDTGTESAGEPREEPPALPAADPGENQEARPTQPTRARSSGNQAAMAPGQSTNLADLLERVLDKGIVIAGDITLSLGTVELLTLKIRLLIASVDKAQEIGIDWWKTDPALSSQARREQLEDRIARLEGQLGVEEQEGAVERDGDRLEDRLQHLEARARA